MAKKTRDSSLSLEERLEQALIPNWDEPYKLPENWCWIKLDELTSITSGGTPSRGNALYWQNGNIPWVKISDLSGKYVETTEEKITQLGLENSSAKLFKKGTILYSIFATIGDVAILNIDAATNQALAGITCSPFCNVDYLYYVLLVLKDLLVSKAKGVAQVNINQSILKETPIPFAPLEEQQRIVENIESLFSKLDEAKEKVQEVVDGFETRKAAILHKAFSGEFTTVWRAKHTAEENAIIDSVAEYSMSWTKKEQRLLHNEQLKVKTLVMSSDHKWIKCTIGAIARVNNGSTPSRQKPEYWGGNIPWVSSGEVRNNFIYETLEQITEDGFDNASVKLLPVGTVLIAMIGEGKTRGQSAVLKIPATTNQNIAAIIMEHGLILPEYIWYWLQMNYSKNREVGSGSGQQALNCQRVRELEFVFPDYEEQNEIVRILDTLISKERQVKENAETVIEQIETMKKAILARAFRGELGTNDPNEESAIELLKQIL